MTIKPFAIQGADLTLGGVNLQAGTTGVVIPGVTQATGYGVEEVKDIDVQQTGLSHPFVIDNVVYTAKVASGSANVSAYAVYAVSLDDNNYIDEIEVTSNGSYTQQEATTNDDLMYGYSGTETTRANALSNFVSGDWFTIPFVPKMRAKEIETVGGGGGNNITSANGDYSLTIDNDGVVQLDPTVVFKPYGATDDNQVLSIIPTGSEQGNHIHLLSGNIGVTSIFMGNDYQYVRTRADGAMVIGTNDNIPDEAGYGNRWVFNTTGGLVFPDDTTQTTAYTGQVGAGSTGWALLYGNQRATMNGGETGDNWQNFIGSVTDGAGNMYFYGESVPWSQSDSNGRPMITKVNSNGTVLWSTIIHDYPGRASAAQYVKGGEFIILLTEDETDNTTTKQWSYTVNPTDGSLTYPSYTIPSQADVGVILKDSWTFDINGSGTVMLGWAGYTTGENRIVTLTIMTDPAPGTQSFSVLKTDVEGLTSGNYSSCFIDSTNTITSIDDHTSYWTVHVGTSADFTTGSHTIQIPQYTNATLGISSLGGPSGWITVGTAGNTNEYYTSSASDFGNSVTYAVGYNEFGDSIVSKINWNFTADWHKSINLSESDLYLTGVAVYDGYVYTVGDNGNGYAIVTKMDGTGAIIWQRKNSGGPWGFGELSIAIGQSGEIIVASGSHGSFASQDNDIFIIRFNAAGDTVWKRTLGTDWADNAGSDWDGWDTGGTRFLSADGSDYFLALAIRYPNGPDCDAGAVKLPLDGSGVGTWGSGYGIWTYTSSAIDFQSVDITAGSTSITNLIVSDFDITTGSGSTPSVYTTLEPQYITPIGNAVTAGIDRHSVDTGATTITLDATQNGKFLYYYGSDGNSTIIVPNNSDVQLPVGYTVTLVIDTFSSSPYNYYVSITTNGDTSDGLTINATGFNFDSGVSNYWGCGGDGKVGIYTLMKVDTNRWILSGPNVFIDD